MTSTAELTLQAQLEQAGIGFDREFFFAKSMGRRWRADFAVIGNPVWNQPEHSWDNERVLVEIDGGGYTGGRHSRGLGMERDAEKQSAAAILGYRVIRCTPRQVNDGTCLGWIRAAIGAVR